ncbi:serine protease grass-like isoform X2 [Drosophila novamexicana]|uniref:serine protease grass-like isoform X2 n=1 Tax=Drosophila novamexicana TaxID=47314 RepID=UPI0011E5E0FB|nr:serine protease grass-like isoform X2 [Drosophila novamexicana]
MQLPSSLLILCTILWSQSLCVRADEANGLRILEAQKCGIFLTIRITNGHEVALGSRPWMSLLRLRHGQDEAFACAGTLITDRFVLTAAHCLTRNELVSVRLGEHQLSTETDCKPAGRTIRCLPPVEDIDVERVFRHADYVPETNHNDIALIQLARPVAFKPHIRPICLPINATLQQRAESSENFVVTGWGTTEDGSDSDVLLETAIDTQTRRSCFNSYAREIKQTQLCAGALRSDSCRGDSGGPLSYPAIYSNRQRFVQFGIVSYGARSCGSGFPAVYTNIASFIPWITNIIGANS